MLPPFGTLFRSNSEADRMDAKRRNNLEVERSPLGTLYRRTYFLVQYLCAIAQSRALARFLPIVEGSFKHAWVAEVQLQIRFLPGQERAWLLARNPQRSMHWDAPITVSVFRKKRGKKRLALCFSMYVIGKTLHIKQIQGVSGTDVPNELKAWPKIFMEACRTFALQESFREVRIPRADSLYSYHTPTLNPELLPESRERAVQQIRTNMRLLYDANALDLGFVSDGAWFKWLNPVSCLARVRTWAWGALALLHPALKVTQGVTQLSHNVEGGYALCISVVLL
jgi:hypothetical protein